MRRTLEPGMNGTRVTVTKGWVSGISFVCFVFFVVKNPLLTQPPSYLRRSVSSADKSAPSKRR